MFGQAAIKLRRTFAALSVAIACLFCVQSVVVALDRIEHALDMDHHPHQLAGTVQCSAQVADGCDSTDGVHPISHVHQGDTPTNILAVTAAQVGATTLQGQVAEIVDSIAGPGIGPLLPERPPKA